MTNLETIERLCAVVEKQSKIIKEQAAFIEEQLSVDEAVKAVFSEKRNSVDAQISEICEQTVIPLSQ